MIASKNIIALTISAVMLALASCREDDVIFIPEDVPVSTPEYTSVKGFYLLNEGNMGSNKCTLDYYDYATGVYTRNVYGNANPSVPKELGDVGNDLAVYGSRLYAVVNVSNKVEVMNAATTERIGQIDIPNCRFIKFHKGYAYVTSYAGPVVINPDYEQLGYVAKVDTTTLQVVAQCVVGFQPDGLEITGGRIYVANSGGYMAPNYEHRLSVIDINSFTVIDEIEVGLNPERLVADHHGGLWITCRGDYMNVKAALQCYDVRKQRMVAQLDMSVGNLWLDGDSLYVVNADWTAAAGSGTKYGIVDVNEHRVVCDNVITDGTDAKIKAPYGIMVNPITKDFYISDARNYVNPGYLYCYGRDGVQKWSVRTGDVPAHMAMLGDDINDY